MNNLHILLLAYATLTPDALGFNVAFFILGMGGGFVRTIANEKITIRSGVINILVGGIVSTYLTPVVVEWRHFKEKGTVFLTAIALGFAAMGFFVVYGKMEKWAQRNPKYFISLFLNWVSSWAKNLAPPTDTTNINNDANDIPKSDTKP